MLKATIAALLASAEGVNVRSKTGADLASYSFDRYVREFERDYAEGSDEYHQRATVFLESLEHVRHLYAKNRKEGRSWLPGIHPFMDWTQEERARLNGYKPSPRSGGRRYGGLAALQTGVAGKARMNTTWANEFMDMDSGAEVSPPMRSQGSCGSCWAISAVEAVESQLIKSGQASNDIRLSAQALVDCTPNPQHCGGTGGCDGATGELAYSFMRDHGIPLEKDLPYHGRTEDCPSPEGNWPTQTRARVDGWNQLPSNKQQPVMQALVNDGPVVVAVEGDKWFDYDSGVFDGCDKDAVLSHAVLLKGYGQDSNSGKKYWHIQNSWGANWGENGNIKLLRQDNEDTEYCGTDNKPQDGIGCDGGPPEVEVCGMCGLLYDPVVPQGARLETSSSL